MKVWRRLAPLCLLVLLVACTEEIDSGKRGAESVNPPVEAVVPLADSGAERVQEMPDGAVNEGMYDKKAILEGIVDESTQTGFAGGFKVSSSNTTAPGIADHPLGRETADKTPVRVLVTESDNLNALYRSEISTESWASSPYALRFGHLYKIEVEILVGEYTHNPDEWAGSILQFHAVAPTEKLANGKTDINWEYKTTGSNPLSLAIRNNRYYAVVNNTPRQYALGRAWFAPSDAQYRKYEKAKLGKDDGAPVPPNKNETMAGEIISGKPIKWILYLRPSADEDGLVEVWKKEEDAQPERIVTYRGANMDRMGVHKNTVKNPEKWEDYVNETHMEQTGVTLAALEAPGSWNQYIQGTLQDGTAVDANVHADAFVPGARELTPHVYMHLGVYGGNGNGYRKIYYDNLKITELTPRPVSMQEFWLQNVDVHKRLQRWNLDENQRMDESTIVDLEGLPETDPWHRMAEDLWRVVGTADFDGDGTPDLLWECLDEGWHALRLRLMTEGGEVKREVSLDPSKNYEDRMPVQLGTVSRSWRVAAVADINRDGVPDLVLQHAENGRISIWLMAWTEGKEILKRTQIVNVKDRNGNLVGSPEWKIAGAGDVDGDGKADFVLQKINGCGEPNQALRYWFMDEGILDREEFSNVKTTPGWRLVGLTDVDGDDVPDVVLQHIAYAAIGWYRMAGSQAADTGADFTLRSLKRFPKLPYSARNWRVVGASGAWVTEPIQKGCP